LSFNNNNKNAYPKGRALMNMYRVVSQTKREYCHMADPNRRWKSSMVVLLFKERYQTPKSMRHY